MIVSRSCTLIPPGDEKQKPETMSRPLSEFRDAPAYVLLGDPGSGKTTAFVTEKEALGYDSCLISARDFLALDLDMHPEWRNKTLFIDGLDEVRIGATDARTPFDEIRNRLERLGRPRFRLSCREADWLGENDSKGLKTVSSDENITVLRLDSLSASDIDWIISENNGIQNPRAFVKNALEQGLGGLLANPQTLNMLVDVVAQSKEWPESRLQTFEQACSYLVREHNKEHKVGGQSVKTKQLLDAAGRLCAVHLISGIKGYTQATGDPDSDFPALEDIEHESPATLQAALSSKLFKAESGSLNRFCPIHRHIAEFLGARYLARLMEDGLPLGRVLSLITGEDEIVVTGLRGLSAWLAAYCKRARSVLIERDSVGVGLYGDIRVFSPDEKRALMETLSRDVYRLGSIRTAPAFGPLATPEMEPFLRDTLSHGSRESEHQMFVSFVLRFLREGSRLRGLSGLLLDIVRDESRSPGINELALNAFIHCEDEKTANPKLKKLLTEIQDGIVSDPDHELLGILLWHLYPRELPPIEVWDYLWSASDQSSLIGHYKLFWSSGLVKKSNDEQVVALLNALRDRRFGSRSNQANVHLYVNFPLRLLARGLHVHGDQLDTQHLYDWLDSGLAADPVSDDSIAEIRTWLENRRRIQKNVIIEGLNRCPQSDDFRYCAFSVQKRLFGADLPADFGHWCLEQAVQMTSAEPLIADHLLELAWQCYTERRGNKGLSLELLKENSRNNNALMSMYLDQLRVPGSSPGADRVEDRDTRKASYIDRRQRQEKQWLDDVRSNEVALRENRAAPVLLHEIARMYFGDFFGFNANDAPKAIEKRLRGESGLIDATFAGLRGTVEREDIPKLQEIIDIKERGRMHALGWPFLASLAESDRKAPVEISRWDEERIRTAIGFYYCTPHGEYRPDWYARLLENRPDIVADVQVRFARSELRSGRHSIYKLWELAHDPSHAEVARLASIRLLRSFPTRCKTEQIDALDNLLWSALRYADRTLFRELIESKLARKSMNDAQRVRWFAAAVVVSPAAYVNPLMDFVQGRENRIRTLVGFFPFVFSDAGLSLTNIELDIAVLEVLVLLVGACYGPDQRWNEESDDEEGGLVEPEMQGALLVDILIRRLAGMSDDSASITLDRLLGDNKLPAWHDVLSRARDYQRVIHRDTGYRHPEPHQVCRTLDSAALPTRRTSPRSWWTN